MELEDLVIFEGHVVIFEGHDITDGEARPFDVELSSTRASRAPPAMTEITVDLRNVPAERGVRAMLVGELDLAP